MYLEMIGEQIKYKLDRYYDYSRLPDFTEQIYNMLAVFVPDGIRPHEVFNIQVKLDTYEPTKYLVDIQYL